MKQRFPISFQRIWGKWSIFFKMKWIQKWIYNCQRLKIFSKLLMQTLFLRIFPKKKNNGHRCPKFRKTLLKYNKKIAAPLHRPVLKLLTLIQPNSMQILNKIHNSIKIYHPTLKIPSIKKKSPLSNPYLKSKRVIQSVSQAAQNQ